MGRHTYSILSEILDSDGEACRARYLHRITEGDKLISEEEMTGYAYRPAREVLWRELEDAGFIQAEEADGLLAWRLALDPHPQGSSAVIPVLMELWRCW